MSKTSYTILMPGLLKSKEQIQRTRAPQLYKWFCKSRHHEVAFSYYPLLLELFHYPKGDYDLARLRAQVDGLDASAYWLCADPIHLGVDVAHVYSLGNAYFNFSLDDLVRYISHKLHLFYFAYPFWVNNTIMSSSTLI